RRPIEFLPDEPIVRVAAAHPGRTIDVALADALPGDIRNNVHQTIDRNHLIGTNVDRSGEVGSHQPQSAYDAFIDVEERAGLFSVAPDFDLASVPSHRHLPTDCGGRFLFAVIPVSLCAVNNVVACNPT